MNIKEKLQTLPAITPKTGDKDTETGDNAGRRRLPLVPYKAFALSGRQVCGHEYPGRVPWEGTEKVPIFKDQNGKCLRFITSPSTNRLSKAMLNRKRRVKLRFFRH